MTTPLPTLAVRAQIAEAIKLDLVSPCAGHPLVAERLPETLPRATWYLISFLIPSGLGGSARRGPVADPRSGEAFSLV